MKKLIFENVSLFQIWYYQKLLRLKRLCDEEYKNLRALQSGHEADLDLDSDDDHEFQDKI